MLFIRTVEGITHTLGKLVRGEQAVSLHHSALAVQPFGFDGVEPGAFHGQIAHQYPHSVAIPFILHFVVVLSDPFPNLPANVPRRIVPHHHEHSLALPLSHSLRQSLRQHHSR